MFRFINQFFQRFASDAPSQGMRPDPYEFAGGTANIVSFTDPALFPAPRAAALIDAVVSARPDAAELRTALAARLQPEVEALASTRWQDSVAASKPAGRSL